MRRLNNTHSFHGEQGRVYACIKNIFWAKIKPQKWDKYQTKHESYFSNYEKLKMDWMNVKMKLFIPFLV